MSTVVPRTCTELRDEGAGDGGDVRPLLGESTTLTEFRSTPAYVLLGDPGAGKTTEFDREHKELGHTALMRSARDFITMDLDSHPEWCQRILFIDGLDEIRAGKTDSRVPLDEIRNRLDRLRPPGFRISCREADWLGHSDRHSLKAVSPDSRITVLRLDPLSEQSARELLESRHSVPDGRAFMAEAHQLGLGAMLGNPLTLELLAVAVKQGGERPETRREAFEIACREMAAEANPEHLAGSRVRPASTILDAAGYLCALQLLSGMGGCSLPLSVAVPSFVALASLREAPSELSRDDLEHALGTKLFTAHSEGLRAPMHRQVAEFLAGRHLAKLIGLGLPVRRVVALMVSPSDERVVTSLRGLSAWLAAHSREARPRLIDADPVGVGLYGDIGDLTTHEKKQVLESLSTFATEASLLGHQRQDGRSFGYRDDTAWAFRTLAAADMVPTMRELLLGASTSATDDRLVTLILGTLSHADDPQSVADLRGDLKAILWSEAGSTQIRKRFLTAYLHIVPPSDDRTRALRSLLEASQDGSVPDPDDEVRGALLENLYPDAIAPSEVWRYALPRNHDLFGAFWRFWDQTLLARSSDQHLAELLDSLHEDAARLIPALTQSRREVPPAELLARCLEANGEDQEPARLYGWLATAGDLLGRSDRNEEPARRVRAWLEARPEVQKEIVLNWLRQRDPDDALRPLGYWFCGALHGSTLPPDFGLWCLDQAIQIGETEPAVSQALLCQAYRSLHEPSTSGGLTLEAMRERTRGHPALAQRLDELCERRSTSSAEDDERHRELEELREQRRQKQRQRQKDWANNLRAELDDLCNNRFFAPDLHTLAQVYLGMGAGADREVSPQQLIRDFIGGDDGVLVDAVMGAIRGALFRDDVPEADQTVALHLESRHSWLAYPVLASLHLLDEEDPARLDRIDAERKRRALAIHYCVPSDDESPSWHDRWFQQEPELVLDVLYRCAVSAVRAGEEFVPCLNILDSFGGRDDSIPVLAFDKSTGLFEARPATPRFGGHDDLVHDTRLRVLDSIPVRGPNKQTALLDNLLARAMQHPDRASLRELAARKSSLTSMTVAQRVRWLTVDALLSAGPSLQPVKEYVSANGREVRVRHLAEFLRRTSRHDDMRRSVLADAREPEVLRDAIEILGPSFGPVQWGESGWITLGMEMSELIGSVIEQLGTLAGDEADRALKGLIDDPLLARWQDRLRLAHERQRIVHRDASYRHPGIEQVQQTLRNQAPANAADLAALLVDRFADISADLRGGDSNPWRQYWNEDRYGHPSEAKPENSCRDALVEALRSRLPREEVTLAPEARYASETRADIRVSCRGFNVPVEIKKNSHPDLWSALRRQLIAQYTTDPATSGYGIYLVLWFGAHMTTRSPEGERPSTTEELRQALEKDLNPGESRKISVIVMDVTKPNEPSR